MSDVTIPAGMKPWAGGDAAPDDWDGGPVLGDDGEYYEWDEDGGLDWRHGLSARKIGADIIAYDTRTTPEPASTQEEREAIAREVLYGVMADDPMIDQVRSGHIRLHHVAWDHAIAAMLAFADRYARPSASQPVEAVVDGPRYTNAVVDHETPFDVTQTGDQRAGEVERLLVALAKIMPISTHNTPDYAEVTFSDGEGHRSQAMTMNPADWSEINDAYAALSDHKGGGE